MAVRVTREYADVLGAGEGEVRVTRQYVEMLTSGYPKARVARQYVEVLASLPDDAVRMTRQCVAVLGNPPEAEEIFVNASDAITINDTAGFIAAYVVAASDTLSLSDEVTRVYEVSASDLIALSNQALGDLVRVAIDTLVLTDEAIADIEVVRSVTDTLSLGGEAVATAIWLRSAEDTLTLQDEATASQELIREAIDWLLLTDAAGWIVTASDILSLSDEATVDRILGVSDTLVLDDEASTVTIYSRVADDSLTFDETVIPGFTASRGATDALSLGETAIGDYCKVAKDTLVLSDAAVFEFVRLIADELILTDEASFIGVFQREVHEFVVLTDEVHLEREVDAGASDAISLTDEVSLIFEASDALSLGDSAVADYCRIASDELLLVELAEATRDRYEASDELILTEAATVNVIRTIAVYDFIAAFTERAWPGFHRVLASDELQTSYTEYDPYTHEETVVYVGLQDLAVTSVIYAAPKEVEDHLSFGERAICIKIRADAIAANASDSFLLTEEVHTNLLASAADLTALSDAAEIVASKLLTDGLALSDEANFSINRNNLSASDTLELGETVLWYNRLEDFLYVYHPFVGEGSGEIPDPPDEELEGPISGITDPFKLVYPVIGPFDDTLVLRAPNLGNRDRLQMNRISRETRGGTLIVYADSMWPKIQILVLVFSGLAWAEASGLHTFMDAHLGLEIGILDWEHRFWRGVVTKQDDPIVQDGPGCKYTVGFEFEGELTMYDPGP